MGLRMKISLYGVKGFECVDRLTGLRRVQRDPTKRILQLSHTVVETRLENLRVTFETGARRKKLKVKFDISSWKWDDETYANRIYEPAYGLK